MVWHLCKFCTTAQSFPRKVEQVPQNQEICPTNSRMEQGRGVVLKTNRHSYLQKATGKRYFNKYMQKKQQGGEKNLMAISLLITSHYFCFNQVKEVTNY